MNNTLSFSCLILSIAPLFFSCQGAVEESKNNALASFVSLQAGNEKHYILDHKKSVVTWTGSGVEGKQEGYAHVSKGELILENGQLTGGTVEIYMKKIEDLNKVRDNDLINHLKSHDFFDVERFPFSTMTITKVESIQGENIHVTANLTIKGITQPVTFPAKMSVETGGIVKANGKLVIDRTRWGIRYRSGKFYDNLADKTISDSIELKLTVVALSDAYHTPPGPVTYTDSNGATLIIENSFPVGAPYTHPEGKTFGYRIFSNRITNESTVPLELTINFPADSLAIFPKPGSYLKLFLLPNTITPDKESWDRTASGVESFFNTNFYKPTRLQTAIGPKEESHFYIGLVITDSGVVRTRLVLKGQDLFYRIDISGQLDSVLIPCGKLVFKK